MSGEYEIVDEATRQQAGDAVVANIRARYPAEPEIDKILTRKMDRRREGKGYQGVTVEQLADGTQKLITARLGEQARIANARWLSGGASKLQMVFDLDWRGPDGGDVRTETLVLRMEPAASVTESSRALISFCVPSTSRSSVTPG